jgi:FMN phosphatase YigB (HAD superfamily)
MTKPIVALDIDGTLGDHYTHFAQFAALWLGRNVEYRPEAGWPDGATKFQFYSSLGTSRDTYRKIKLAYRLGGMKRSMPMYDGAPELTDALVHMGVSVWICTSRPYLRLDTMDPDTRHWLKRCHIKFHNVIYGDYKYRELSKIVGSENVICVLDDLPEMCAQASRAKLNPILIERPHNKDRPDDGYLSVKDLWEAQQIIGVIVEQWQAKRNGR